FLTNIDTRSGSAAVLQALSYGYFKNGDLDFRKSNAPGDTYSESFLYDSLRRLKQWQVNGAANAATYNYDDLGNMTSRVVTGNLQLPNVTYSYTDSNASACGG